MIDSIAQLKSTLLTNVGDTEQAYWNLVRSMNDLRILQRLLERGEEVAFEPERMRFSWGEGDPGRLFQMRWFLREGWGALAHYGIHESVMREPRAR